MNNGFYAQLAIIAGAVLPVQAALNARLGHEMPSPLWASGISFTVGAIVLLPLLFFFSPKPDWSQAFSSVPYLSWLAGLLGIFYVSVSLITVRHLGAVALAVFIIFGQLLSAAILENWSILLDSQPLSKTKLIGLSFVAFGAWLVVSN